MSFVERNILDLITMVLWLLCGLIAIHTKSVDLLSYLLLLMCHLLEMVSKILYKERIKLLENKGREQQTTLTNKEN